MKKVIILLTVLHSATLSFCQTKLSEVNKLKAQIITLEKAGWEAWRNKNITWFQKNTTEDCLWISAAGISNKAEMIKSTRTDCNVKTVAIDSFTFKRLNENAVLLTYIAMQDGYCGNKKLPEKIRASVNYIRRAGRWLESFYMETPIVE